MNESTTARVGCHARCTTKAIAPRWISGVLRRPPEFPPRATAPSESSTSEVSVSLLRSESQCDKQHSYAVSSHSDTGVGIDRPQKEDPNYWDMAACRTRSTCTPNRYMQSAFPPSHPSSLGWPCPTVAFGVVAKRAYLLHQKLMRKD